MKRKIGIALVLLLLLIPTILLTYGSKKYVRGGDTIATILQITDVHIKNDAKKDARAFKTITGMIESTKPDKIIVTGDVTSEHDNGPAFRTFGAFMETFGIPWTFTFGNHDSEGDLSKEEISDYLESLEHCFYERGSDKVDGAGEQYVNIEDESGKVVMSLIMMDSNMYPPNGLEGYDTFHENQIEWYRNTIKTIAKDVNGSETNVVPSLVFFHIPMREFTTAYDLAKKNGEIIRGYRFEKEYSGYEDDTMFETMTELGSTKGVFVGHDHMNDYSVDYEGIRLTYGNSSDHNMYVVPRRGGNLINIKRDGTFTTQQLIRHRLQNKITVKGEK